MSIMKIRIGTKKTADITISINNLKPTFNKINSNSRVELNTVKNTDKIKILKEEIMKTRKLLKILVVPF